MKEEILKQYDDKIAAAKAELYDAAYSEGAKSVEAGEGMFTQEQVDAKIQEAIANLPADQTPYGQADLDAIQEKVSEAEAKLVQAQSDDEMDKSTIAQYKGILDQIKGLLPAQPQQPQEPQEPQV